MLGVFIAKIFNLNGKLIKFGSEFFLILFDFDNTLILDFGSCLLLSSNLIIGSCGKSRGKY